MLQPLIKKIQSGIRSTVYVFWQEMRGVFHDQGIFIFFILVPLFYPLIYSYVYSREVLHEVPVVVVDRDRSSLSRDYLRRVDATPDVEIIAQCADMEEARMKLKLNEAYGIIFVPETFSHNLAVGEQSSVTLFCDMGSLLYYKSIVLSNTLVSLAMNKEIKVQRVVGATERQGELIAYPIEYEEVALFNPTTGFASFLLPAVLMLLLQQTMLLGVGMSAGTMREGNKYRDLIPLNRHYDGTLRILIGKGVCYFLIYLLVSVYVLCAVPRMFNLLQLPDPLTLLGFVIPYLFSCVFFSLTASVFIKNRETCMLLFVFTSVPLLFISGISWPGSSISAFWRYISYLFPSTFGINGFVKINSMGASLWEVQKEYVGLWLQTGFYFITSFFVYRWQVLQSRRHLVKEYRRLKS
ncbi:MAG: ABC transporter permease [Bacteroides sp.]